MQNENPNLTRARWALTILGALVAFVGLVMFVMAGLQMINEYSTLGVMLTFGGSVLVIITGTELTYRSWVMYPPKQ